MQNLKGCKNHTALESTIKNEGLQKSVNAKLAKAMKKRKNSIFSLFLTRIQYIKKINFLCNRMNEVTVLTIFGTHTQNT